MSKGLHLELLKEYEVTLCQDGQVLGGNDRVHYDGKCTLGYRDEGPDAWASSCFFSGPAWFITTYQGWEFWEDGVQFTGYDGLCATVVNTEDDGLHVTEVVGEEY